MFSFFKMQATGNDFILINYFENKLQYSYKLLAEFLCDRHFGIGADGLLILEKSEIADFKMKIFNKDGSEAEMCGNGIRCFAKFVYEKNLTDKNNFLIETMSGVKNIKLELESEKVSRINVDMGDPIFDIEKIPIFYNEKNYTGSIYIDGIEVYPISMGNPHAVCFVENLNKLDINKYGKLIEEYKYFPNKTNVEFVQIINKNQIKVRIWERGVGETYSCGTGVCAAGVISNLYKSTNDMLNVETKGGNLNVLYNKNVTLIGYADFVFEGKIDI